VTYEEKERVLDDRVQSEASRRQFVATSAAVDLAAASGTQQVQALLAQLPGLSEISCVEPVD
jgi:hypothetical protein